MDDATKISLLRELTAGPDDVYALRSDGKWRPVYRTLTDDQLRLQLQGHIEIGAYPIIPNGAALPMLRWIAADFDGKKEGVMWEQDVSRTVDFLLQSGCTLFVNLSRSALGAHVRVLFKEPVPAWLARRWMTAWLEEAGVMKEAGDWDDEVPASFDRLIPPQDALSGDVNWQGNRRPGNLAGSPHNGALARKNGGTLALDPREAAQGNFVPDGRHWEHVVTALEARTWGRQELIEALAQAPGSPSAEPPNARGSVKLPVIKTDSATLQFTMQLCEFMRHMRKPGTQNYALWVALATELHRWGDAGRVAFHEISALDSRYDPKTCDKKWEETALLHPVRCDRLVEMGYRCPHLGEARCNRAAAPAFFHEHAHVELL